MANEGITEIVNNLDTVNWQDPRLALIYYLADAIVSDYPVDSDFWGAARRIRELAESLDCDLEGCEKEFKSGI